jgi:indole-3-glycerol phosphate synthase
MNGPISVLGEIVARTRARVFQRRRELPLDRLLSMSPTPGGHRQFASAISVPDRVNVIAEFKRRSPSRGSIRPDLHPVLVAQAYEIGGAAALSVLTEEESFGGSLDDLQQARSATLLPALRKDFIVDPYQIWESWIAGTDGVLLIVAALSDTELTTLLTTAVETHLDAMVEVHSREELARALDAGARIVGVNNRDLVTLEVSLDVSLALGPAIPDDVIAVAESGMRSGADIRRLREVGFDAFLVGEHLMLADDQGAALERLLAESGGEGNGGRGGG